MNEFEIYQVKDRLKADMMERDLWLYERTSVSCFDKSKPGLKVFPKKELKRMIEKNPFKHG